MPQSEQAIKVAGILGAVALVLVLVSIPHAVAAEADAGDDLQSIKKDLEELKQGQERLRKDIDEIKTLLKRRGQRPPASAAVDVVFSIANDPSKGNADAPVTIVEFSDYQCPFCGRHFRQTFSQLDRDYIATGKVKYVFRDFPIERIHPQAFKASVAANCAGEQGKYWPMHDRLFANQKDLEPGALKKHADAVGVDSAVFEACFESDVHDAEIKQDLAEGQKAGVRGTPTFFLGLTTSPGSDFKATRVLRGAQPYAQFKQEIDRLLSGQQR